MFISFNKILKTQTGFSLTEVMVGGAVLAGVGLAGAMMFRDQRKAQQSLAYEQNLNSFHQSLIKTLSNPATCNATFRNSYGSSIAAGSLDIYSCIGSNCANSKLDAGSVTRSPSPIFRANAANNFIDGQKNWEITNIENLSAVSATGPLKLRVSYKTNSNRTQTPKTVTKEILLNVRFNKTGGFKECVNNQESSLNNLQNDLCKSMNFDQITSNGNVVKWNEDTQSCDVINTAKTCGPGLVIEGIRSDGSVHCKPATTYFGNDGQLDSSSNKNCPLGTKMVFTGGKMEIQCL